MASLIAARRNANADTETREEARERYKRERRDAQLKLQKEAREAKEALEAARKAEADAIKEEKEAAEAEAQALQEEQEAEEAREKLKKEEEDVLRVEALVLTLESRLAEGEDVASELEAQQATLEQERREVDEARAAAEKELREAREAKETAAKEKAEALEARAKAVAAAQIAAKELREAEEAAWEKGQNNWVLARAEAHDPLVPEDNLYRVLFFPLKQKLEKEREAVLTKTGKRKIDNLINTIHRQCEYMQEDMDFLLQCFEYLDEDEDELLTEDEIRIWLTVLNHGEQPTPDEMENCIKTLDDYRDMLDALPTEGVLEKEDFFLVTFDYYLALGKTYMRSLYMDLLLT